MFIESGQISVSNIKLLYKLTHYIFGITRKVAKRQSP